MRRPDIIRFTPRQDKPKPAELTREKLAHMNTLEVEVAGEFETILESVRVATGANLQPRGDGFHLTIIGPAEKEVLRTLDDAAILELALINNELRRGTGLFLRGIGYIDGASSPYTLREVDRTKKTAFLAVDIPRLQAFRQRVGLPPKDFHITLGFEGGDIHVHIVGQEPIKPNSPKMKDVTALIPKQADPRLNEITLPEVRFGGLTGETKESA